MTAPEFARTFSQARSVRRERVAPATAYGVARVQQEFGARGIDRRRHDDGRPSCAVADGDPLAALLTRNAFSFSSDSLLRLNDGEYDLSLFAGMGYVDGESAAIDRLQRSSARYLPAARCRVCPLRPDADVARRRQGRGQNRAANAAGTGSGRRGRRSSLPSSRPTISDASAPATASTRDARLEYRETVPGRWWRDYSIWVGTENEWNYGRDRQNGAGTPASS